MQNAKEESRRGEEEDGWKRSRKKKATIAKTKKKIGSLSLNREDEEGGEIERRKASSRPR